MSAQTNNVLAILILVVGLAVLVTSALFDNFACALIGGAACTAAIGLYVPAIATPSLMTVSMLVALAIAEVGLFWMAGDVADSGLVRDYSPGYASITGLGQSPNPGHHQVRMTDENGQVVYDVTYSIGQDGFRVTPGTSEDGGRVNFYGCSILYGEGVKDDETLPYFVSTATSDAGQRVAVKNFAASGFGVHQAVKILRVGEARQGDVNVLLTVPWHASRSACIHDWTVGAPRFQRSAGGELEEAGVCPARAPPLPLDIPVLRHSKIYQTVANALATDRPIMDEDIELYLALVSEMSQLSKARGQWFVVGFLPADERYFADTQYSNERIRQSLVKQADAVIDLGLEGAEAAPSTQYPLHELDGHPNRLANQVRAT